MNKLKKASAILGIDIGPNSIGWALIERQPKIKSGKIIAAGARIFQAGLNDLTLDGKGKSRNTQRREARSRRRILERRRRRLKVLGVTLQKAGLLPKGNLEDSWNRNAIFTKLDSAYGSPYSLRARGLDEKLDYHELGRALYHLAQRRGFLSNRRESPDKEVEEKGIKKDIGDLAKCIDKSGSRTLGKYFSSIDPKIERIRNRYTSRKMYNDEFQLIWQTQQKCYPEILTDSFRKKVEHIIFYQRPLKSQKGLIGECELESERKRAPWALLSSQRLRYLQVINNLMIIDDDNPKGKKLSEDQRKVLIATLETKSEISFGGIRKLLKLKGTKFNLEFGGEKRIIGNRTAAKLMSIFGENRWLEFNESKRQAVVEDIRSIVKDETLKKRALEYWKLENSSAEKLSKLRLEDGYSRFSRQAITKLIPILEEGQPLQTAIKECYPGHWERTGQPCDILPPIKSEEMPALRNPIVERSLTELRRVVNAIIRQYGKPDIIRVELARELRQTSKRREQTWKRMRANEKQRENAANKIIEEFGIQNPTPSDILKVVLAEECNWQCPYTGRTITLPSLIGDHPQFDIEHIIPFERSLDNSFLNKTLCYAEENRNRKHNRTPHEAYHHSDKWDEMTFRIKDFKGDSARPKLRRFLMQPDEVQTLLDNFTNRQLNDTCYAAKLAKQYLGLLYGGIDSDGIDADNKRRVQASIGPTTAYLRNEWNLNSILGDGPGKSRDDHRHHAVDAIAVAISEPNVIKLLGDAARKAEKYGRRLFEKIPEPWDGFHEEVKATINNIVVSHQVSKRVRGQLHEETFYGTPQFDENGKVFVTVRKPLDALSKKELENIIDPAVKESVKKKLEELGGDVKRFAEPENHPILNPDGKDPKPIHKVRIRTNLNTFPVGEGHRVRHVQSETNHHMEIAEVDQGEGKEPKWEGHVVSMYEAYRRLNNHESVIQRDFGKRKKFLFSIACGDIIELDSNDNKERFLYVVRTVPQSKQIRFVPVNDARIYKQNMFSGLSALPDPLRKRGCRKAVITPLGQVRYAND